MGRIALKAEILIFHSDFSTPIFNMDTDARGDPVA